MLAQQIDPVFFDIFGKKFEGTVIDEEQDLLDQADRCAAELGTRIEDVQGLVSALEKFLETNDPDVLQQLGVTSNMRWDFDADTEAALRTIVMEIVDELKS